jgi:hypothetical protein
LTPLEPRAGPTGGEGEAWPAPTMSLTIWSVWIALRAMVAVCCVWFVVEVCACLLATCHVLDVGRGTFCGLCVETGLESHPG